MRLFVAIAVPETWRVAAAAQQHALLEALPPEARVALRPVAPALMHVTLRFLGDVDEGGRDPLQAALDAIPAPDVLLTLAHAGAFGAPARTAVVWLGLGGDGDALRALAERVEQAVRVAGLPPETRPFAPHLMLARVRGRAPADTRRAVAEAVRAFPPPPPSPHRAREVILVRSHLGPRTRYDVLSRHP